MSTAKGRYITFRLHASTAVIVAAATCASAMGAAYAQSANTLIREGNQAFKADECVRAAERYYALQVHYPDWLDEGLTQKLAGRIEWCEANTSVNALVKGDDPNSKTLDQGKPPDDDLVTAGAHDDRCKLYAQIAIAQYRVNRMDNCGFSGSRWSETYSLHHDWCIGASNKALDAESLARQQALINCHNH